MVMISTVLGSCDSTAPLVGVSNVTSSTSTCCMKGGGVKVTVGVNVLPL